jgi:glycosyltransferase involved in cell wall biosynthesis
MEMEMITTIENAAQVAKTTHTQNSKKTKTITLCMIVKDEARVIERCLASVLPIIDYWVIVDTGSTDGTQEKIRKFFENVGIPGELHERPWKDFGHNRSEALELARDKGDYAYMIDADEVLVFEPGFDPEQFKAGLTADLYNIFASYGGTKYHRPQMTSNKKRFYYRGILHEYVDCHDEIQTRDFARGFINTPIQDGNRSSQPMKYERDAERFEEALKGEVDPKDFHRYHFYLAQSYRDSQQWEKALAAYIKRAELGGWNEEVFYSLYQAGRIMEVLNKNIDDIIKMYFNAYQSCPYRAESLWAAARLCRLNIRFDQAYTFSKQAMKCRCPEGSLFIAAPVYEWMLLDEFAIAAYWTGHFKESYQASKALLQQNKFPPDQKERMEANLKFAAEELMNGG